MPPFKLQIRCLECPYKYTGYYPGILLKADKHAATRLHAIYAYSLNGTKYCEIPSPASEETW